MIIRRVSLCAGLFFSYFVRMMRLIYLPLFLLLAATLPVYAQDQDSEKSDIRYTDGHDLVIIGKYHEERTYGRFPARYKETLRPAVWRLGQNSAGMGIRFRTD